MLTRTKVFFLATVVAIAPAHAKHHHHDRDESGSTGLADVTLLVVRHAEKPMVEGDVGLAPAGETRAKAYVSYFQHFTFEGSPVHVDALIASADSRESARPRLTLEPLAKATGLPVQQPFANKQYKDFARWMESGDAHLHGTALVAWHHGKLAKLLERLGADPATILPGGEWPENVYDWVIVLRYGPDGHLAEAKRITEPSDLK